MSYSRLIYETRDRAAWITLNRPDDLNCIDDVLAEELCAAIDQAETDDEARVVVLTGAGRAFCAGADLKHVRGILGSGDPETVRRFMRFARNAFARIAACEKPLIAAVNGIAAAGGCELILACDLVIAAESATIGDAHANYGLLPGGGGAARLPRKVGQNRAKYLLYTGEFLPAATLCDWGLVNEVVPDDGLMLAVEALVAKLTAKSPLVLRRMKTMVDDGLESSLDAALRLETSVWEGHATSEDFAEGLTAFSEKRAPNYTGR
jgi:enoyl-CoA hydratase/carnithine racemase